MNFISRSLFAPVCILGVALFCTFLFLIPQAYAAEYDSDGQEIIYYQSSYYDYEESPQYDEDGYDVDGQYWQSGYATEYSQSNYYSQSGYQQDYEYDDYGSDAGGQYTQSGYQQDYEYDDYGSDAGEQYTQSAYKKESEGTKKVEEEDGYDEDGQKIQYYQSSYLDQSDDSEDESDDGDDCGWCIGKIVEDAANAMKDVLVNTAKEALELGEQVLESVGIKEPRTSFTSLPPSSSPSAEEIAERAKKEAESSSVVPTDNTSNNDANSNTEQNRTTTTSTEEPVFTKQQQEALDRAEKLGLDVDSPVIEAAVLTVLDSTGSAAATAETFKTIISETEGDPNSAVRVNLAFGTSGCGNKECRIADEVRNVTGLDPAEYQVALTRKMQEVDALRQGLSTNGTTDIDATPVTSGLKNTYSQGTYAKYSQSTYTRNDSKKTAEETCATTRCFTLAEDPVTTVSDNNILLDLPNTLLSESGGALQTGPLTTFFFSDQPIADVTFDKVNNVEITTIPAKEVTTLNIYNDPSITPLPTKPSFVPQDEFNNINLGAGSLTTTPVAVPINQKTNKKDSDAQAAAEHTFGSVQYPEGTASQLPVEAINVSAVTDPALGFALGYVATPPATVNSALSAITGMAGEGVTPLVPIVDPETAAEREAALRIAQENAEKLTGTCNCETEVVPDGLGGYNVVVTRTEDVTETVPGTPLTSEQQQVIAITKVNPNNPNDVAAVLRIYQGLEDAGTNSTNPDITLDTHQERAAAMNAIFNTDVVSEGGLFGIGRIEGGLNGAASFFKTNISGIIDNLANGRGGAVEDGILKNICETSNGEICSPDVLQNEIVETRQSIAEQLRAQSVTTQRTVTETLSLEDQAERLGITIDELLSRQEAIKQEERERIAAAAAAATPVSTPDDGVTVETDWGLGVGHPEYDEDGQLIVYYQSSYAPLLTPEQQAKADRLAAELEAAENGVVVVPEPVVATPAPEGSFLDNLYGHFVEVIGVDTIRNFINALPGETVTLPEDRFTAESCATITTCNNAAGMRHNNPMNVGGIEYDWNGRDYSCDSTYCERFPAFVTPEHGIRAFFRDVASKNDRGLVTIEDIRTAYTPEYDANGTYHPQAGVIAEIARKMGIDPDEPFSIDDPVLGPAFAKAMLEAENPNLYSNWQIEEGFRLAFKPESAIVTTDNTAVRQSPIQTLYHGILDRFDPSAGVDEAHPIIVETPAGISIPLPTTARDTDPSRPTLLDIEPGAAGVKATDAVSDDDARRILAAAGVTIYESRPGATDLEGIRMGTLEEIIGLSARCNCDITVTGGTEGGHEAGDFSHSNGFKFDARIIDRETGRLNELATFVQGLEYSRTRGDGARIYIDPDRPNVEYAMEGNHLDVVVRSTEDDVVTNAIAVGVVRTVAEGDGTPASVPLPRPRPDVTPAADVVETCTGICSFVARTMCGDTALTGCGGVETVRQSLLGGTPVTVPNPTWSLPVTGIGSVNDIEQSGGSPFSREFAHDNRGGAGHTGLDVEAPFGSPLRSIQDGTVIRTWGTELSGYGRTIVIQSDDGSVWSYSHNESNDVTVGQRVSAGQTIGQVGNSGNAAGGFSHTHIQFYPAPEVEGGESGWDKAIALGIRKGDLLAAIEDGRTDIVANPRTRLAELAAQEADRNVVLTADEGPSVFGNIFNRYFPLQNQDEDSDSEVGGGYRVGDVYHDPLQNAVGVVVEVDDDNSVIVELYGESDVEGGDSDDTPPPPTLGITGGADNDDADGEGVEGEIDGEGDEDADSNPITIITETIEDTVIDVIDFITGIFGGRSETGDRITLESNSDEEEDDRDSSNSDPDISNIKLITIHLGVVGANCRDNQGVSQHGYVYTVTLRNTTKTIERAGCGVGAPSVFAQAIAQDLDKHTNFGRLRSEDILEKMVFKFYGTEISVADN